MADFTKMSLNRALRFGRGATKNFEEQPKGAYVRENIISKEDADICLNCPKKECSGEAYCFQKRKREIKARAKRIAEAKSND